MSAIESNHAASTAEVTLHGRRSTSCARTTPRTAWHALEGLLLAALLACSTSGRAQTVVEMNLDSILHTFASFTRWPTSALRVHQDPLLICLQQSVDPNTEKRTVHRSDAGIVIRRVVASDDLRSCHLLFVPATEQHRLRESVVSVMGAPVLTVSDADGALEEGVAIEIRSGTQRVQFEVNLVAAQRNHLMISSKLLRVARRVVREASNP